MYEWILYEVEYNLMVIQGILWHGNIIFHDIKYITTGKINVSKRFIKHMELLKSLDNMH